MPGDDQQDDLRDQRERRPDQAHLREEAVEEAFEAHPLRQDQGDDVTKTLLTKAIFPKLYLDADQDAVYVLPTDEELMIARHTLALLSTRG